MKPFDYARPTSAAAALDEVAHRPNSKFLGGGTNLVDLMRENIEQPDALVDITRLPFSEIREREDGGLSLGAGARNTAVASHPLVRARYPMLSEAILSGASGQIRNMATVGGNLMQRTRCFYFYDEAARCNKRQPGAGCDAIEGFNRIHAILGASDACIATHPSDMCVALAALDATVHVCGPQGERTMPFVEFHRLPGDTPHIETELEPGELITSVELAPLDAATGSRYRKVRDRSSYAFALVSVAAAVSIRDGMVAEVRLALGGVAHKPWRAFEAESLLRRGPATLEHLRLAVDAEFAAARSFAHNHFKIELARRAVVSVLGGLMGLESAR
jgi:xanthine dehydrogenase YagS FAD-binding subunit